MTTDSTETAVGVSRRTVLAAGAGVAGAVALGTAVGVQLLARELPLDGVMLAGMVGQAFVDTRTGALLRLESVDGHLGAAPTAERFSLLFTADEDLPAEIRTLRHADGDLVVYLGPVTPVARTLEAVVDRTEGAS